MAMIGPEMVAMAATAIGPGTASRASGNGGGLAARLVPFS
jgi:hypothetical protein